MKKILLACVLFTVALAASAAAQPVAFVVRHAERADTDGAAPGAKMTEDPDLSTGGHARAEALA